MKKRKIVNKSKFYKTMFFISLYINYILGLAILAEKGILGKIWDLIFIIY